MLARKHQQLRATVIQNNQAISIALVCLIKSVRLAVSILQRTAESLLLAIAD